MTKFQQIKLRLFLGIALIAVVLPGFIWQPQNSAAAMGNRSEVAALTQTLDRQVAQSSDDAEETLQSGKVVLNSSDLELINDPDGLVDQVVGIRFTDIDIPPGATILDAYLLFTVDETWLIDTSLTFEGEAANDAATFEESAGNISQRDKTNLSIQWASLPPWLTIDETFQTPNLSAIVREIVNQPGWQAGNALAFLISGSGRRTAFSYDGYRIKSPVLHVEWQLDVTPTATPTLTDTPSPSSTASPTLLPTATETKLSTATPTPTLSPSPMASPTLVATATETQLPTATPTLSPTATPVPAKAVAPQCNRTGGAVRSVWLGVTGALIGDLIKYKLYPDTPDLVQIVNRLEMPPNLDDNYGELIQGYLCPPQSGQYTIWIAGDDQNEIWLSSDNSPKNKRMVASVPSWTWFEEWDKMPEQESVTLTLQANQAYYFEVLHKESISDDSLSIAWAGPGLERQVIAGRYLAPYADNSPRAITKTFLPLVSR